MVALSFADRGRRARELADRYPFAAELLRLYGALIPVQEQAFRAAGVDRPAPGALARYVADRVLPRVVDATASHGPRGLGDAARERVAAGRAEGVVAAWLAGEEQSAVDRYLGRASAAPVLEAMGDAAGEACRGPRDERHCPICGGLPQLGFIATSGDDLVTAPRRLLCARCGHAWIFQRMTCAACGETAEARLPIYSETERFPHLRVDACETCGRYLLTVDLRKDPRAVPTVDELAAVPLDLYAQEHGMRKIVANVLEIG
jgi:FdhE protein